MVFMRPPYVAELDAVWYVCRDHRTGHGGCGEITSLSSYARCHIDHYGFPQCVAGCAFYPYAAYLTYTRSAEIDLSSFCPSSCWFPNIFADGRVHRLFSTKVTLHKRTPSGELSPLQILAAGDIT